MFAKHLKTSLENIEEGTRNGFITISHLDGCLGYEHQLDGLGKIKKSKYDPMTGAAFGLCKTLKQEWPEVFIRAIDLHREIDADDAVKLIIKENHDANSQVVEVGLRDTQRFTLVPKELATKPEEGGADNHKIDADSVFLVSGGAKGVTASCVLELAKHTQCKFILLGRSELNETEPEWAASCADETALKQAAMLELKNSGEKPTPVLVEKFISPVLSQREVLQTFAIN